MSCSQGCVCVCGAEFGIPAHGLWLGWGVYGGSLEPLAHGLRLGACAGWGRGLEQLICGLGAGGKGAGLAAWLH